MIGVIADDFTGATDVAVAFRRSGLRVIVLFGVPSDTVDASTLDVVVVALKTRTVVPDVAAEQSLMATRWLQSIGATQFYFKFCSTFDSRPEGNIGPVADALADHLGTDRVVVVPSSPEYGRSQYLGHLFVGDQLLSDSPMRYHPLTPMTDSSIPRLLRPQTRRRVDLVAFDIVRQGVERIREALDSSSREPRLVIVDALSDEDLAVIGVAVADDVLITGAAGLAASLGAAIASREGRLGRRDRLEDTVDAIPVAVLSGSCSARTLEQIAYMKMDSPSFFLDPMVDHDPAGLAASALAWYDGLPTGSTPLVYSSVAADQLRHIQDSLGADQSSAILETAIGLVAVGLADRGVRRIIVAGGETSGAVVSALGIPGGRIGDEAAPGVPWIYTLGRRHLVILLKSGNFGAPNLLRAAIDRPAVEEGLV